MCEIRRIGSLNSRSPDRSAALGNKEAVTRDLQSDPSSGSRSSRCCQRPITNRPWMDARRCSNGITFKIRTGVVWMHLPDRYGPAPGRCGSFHRWVADGTLAYLLTPVQARADAAWLLGLASD